MKKQTIVILGIIAALAITALAVTQVRRPPTFEFYGEHVIATNAPDGIVAAARRDVP